ncbi:Putative uncharacterized protein [Taphrina deformans PYCC 5710]|uniref:Inclusion body clearance protein IML2 n=1 Tax=Taphrina deformans (strain PYCC 5710 / ATCC 11124 / CBS 356.35 / IMI 108563 / JCM 9778 / NBRC 8474) TaxID=1097556 RepID=R4X8S3_TAPDE|nr:Putative uncharacterized protein [Taphrina deformans PYCC 5710]|eukprot:CCG82049.1 Putative uncharacterized protein [Taphrina deformans PYCC 5710]
MNDELDSSLEVLKNYDDAFQSAALAIKALIQASIGLEKEEIMQTKILLEGALAQCETELALAKALPRSSFGDGAELQVIIGQLLLGLAITGFLSESIPEAMKSVWKMKRCYNIFYDLNKYMIKNNISTSDRAEPHKAANHGDIHAVRSSSSSLDRITTLQLQQAAGSHSVLSPTDYFTACATVSGYGFLSLIISAMPPTVARVLSVVGFKGNKEQALSDLWSVAAAPNIMGALGLLGLLTYYGAVGALCDIVPDTTEQAQKLSDLLDSTIRRYPGSSLWKLTRGRMQQQRGDIYLGIQTLESMQPKAHLKQIEAFRNYDLGFAYVTTFQWEKAVDKFILVEAGNDWSKALYHYLIGSCFVELYRDTADAAFAKKAQFYFDKAPAHAGKKKVMGKELPIEVFLKRKLKKWATCRKDNRLVDGIAVSPIMEICHIYNLWKKMDQDLCKKAMLMVTRQGQCSDAADDVLTRQSMMLALKRRLCDWNAAQSIMQAGVATRQEFKHIPDAELWSIPDMYYERAAFLWARDGARSAKEIRSWLEKVQTFGDAEFEQRLAIKLSTAFQTLDALT